MKTSSSVSTKVGGFQRQRPLLSIPLDAKDRELLIKGVCIEKHFHGIVSIGEPILVVFLTPSGIVNRSRAAEYQKKGFGITEIPLGHLKLRQMARNKEVLVARYPDFDIGIYYAEWNKEKEGAHSSQG